MENQDRSLKDIIKFLDSTNSVGDAEVNDITRNLKFSEVLDLISAVKSNNISAAKEILAKYDDFFASTAPSEEPQESAIPMIKPTSTTTGQSAFPKIAPKGNLPSTANQTGQPAQDQDLDQLVNDPTKQNDPNIKQLKSVLQKMGIQ